MGCGSSKEVVERTVVSKSPTPDTAVVDASAVASDLPTTPDLPPASKLTGDADARRLVLFSLATTPITSDAASKIVADTAPLVSSKLYGISLEFYPLLFAGHPEVLPYFNMSNHRTRAQPKALTDSVFACVVNVGLLGHLAGAVGHAVESGAFDGQVGSVDLAHVTPAVRASYGTHPSGKSIAAMPDDKVREEYEKVMGALYGVLDHTLTVAHKHCALAVRPEMYKAVHDMFLAAVTRVLGKDVVTAEIGAAWSEVLVGVSKLLIALERAIYAHVASLPGGSHVLDDGDRAFEISRIEMLSSPGDAGDGESDDDDGVDYEIISDGEGDDGLEEEEEEQDGSGDDSDNNKSKSKSKSKRRKKKKKSKSGGPTAPAGTTSSSSKSKSKSKSRSKRLGADPAFEGGSRVVSVFLKPTDGRPTPTFLPGQYITVTNVPDGAPDKFAPRHYSISGTAASNQLRVTVKELPAGDGAPAGVMSSFLAGARPGAVLRIRPPMGTLTLRETLPAPSTRAPSAHVFVTAGSGITPTVPMAIEALERGHTVCFLHTGICRELFDEVSAAVEKGGGTRGASLAVYGHRQMVREVAKRVGDAGIDVAGAMYYISGKAAFYNVAIENLLDAGVSRDHVLVEGFAPHHRLDSENVKACPFHKF